MRRVTRHVRVGIAATVAVLLAVMPASVLATTPVNVSLMYATQPKLLITELQTSGAASGTSAQEFVELYNAADQDIDFDGASAAGTPWQLQTFSSSTAADTARTWLKPTAIITLTGTISAHDYYTVSPKGYAPGGIDLSGQGQYGSATSNYFADAGGGVQLVNVPEAAKPQNVTVYDRLLWLQKTAASLPAGVISSPSAGKSLQRITNDDNEYINSDNTLTDFIQGDEISPLEAWQAPAPVVEPPSLPTTDPQDGDTTVPEPPADNPPLDPGTILVSDPVDNSDLLLPQITELLPNPASPLTDAADEFIELYNPNDAPFDLKGYSLEVGTTTLHDFTLTDDVVLPAKSYQAFYSAATKLSLVNSSGQARLLGPDGQKVSETPAYGAAADSAAWALSDGSWQWSTTATPGLANIITASAVSSKAATSTATTKPKAVAKTTVAKTTTAKAKTTTTTKKATAKKVAVKKTTKKKAAAKKPTTLKTAAAVKPKPPIHTGILVTIAVAAVLYGLYEYRHDIASKFTQSRGNRKHRGGDRSTAAWR